MLLLILEYLSYQILSMKFQNISNLITGHNQEGINTIEPISVNFLHLCQAKTMKDLLITLAELVMNHMSQDDVLLERILHKA